MAFSHRGIGDVRPSAAREACYKNEKREETVLDNPVSLRRDGNVAIITIDNPPVNALRHGVRKGILDASSRRATTQASRRSSSPARGARLSQAPTSPSSASRRSRPA
jgi:hypothetical protein